MYWHLSEIRTDLDGEGGALDYSQLAGPVYVEFQWVDENGDEIGPITYATYTASIEPLRIALELITIDRGGSPDFPMDQTLLRSIPLGEFQNEVLDQLRKLFPRRGVALIDSNGIVDPSVAAQWPRGDRQLVATNVEAIYNEAVARQQPATEAVAHAFQVSRSTASRMVKMARENGYDLSDPAPYPGKRKDIKDGTAEAAPGGTRQDHNNEAGS